MAHYLVNGLLILILGALYFLAIRYLRRKGTCAGCSDCKSQHGSSQLPTASSGCDGCCAHCAHSCCDSAPQAGSSADTGKHG